MIITLSCIELILNMLRQNFLKYQLFMLQRIDLEKTGNENKENYPYLF